MLRALGTAYVAGLWMDNLAEELLWYSASDNKRYKNNDLRAPSRWRAPSWTWAALDRAVKFGSYFEEDFDIEVISASTDPKGEDQYGEISSGVLTLRGEAAQANYDFIDQERSVGESGQEFELVAQLEPVPGHLLGWETIMPHNGSQRLDPLGLRSSSLALTSHHEQRCEVRFDTRNPPFTFSFPTSRAMKNRLHATGKMLPGMHSYELFINEGARLPVSPQTTYVAFSDEKREAI